MKIRILHKGLILVGLPLFFGIAFISLLCYGLSESNRIFQHELLLKDAMITDNIITRSTFSARSCGMAFLVTQDRFFKENFLSNMHQATAAHKRLLQLLKNEPDLKLPVQKPMSRRDLIMGDNTYLLKMHAFMKELQSLTEKETASALKAMNLMQVILLGGMLLSAAITIGLAVYFCLNITSRVLIIVNNTINLSKGSPLSPPLKGNDEIAELDQFLFKSATEIRDLERFKKEMIGVVSHELKSPLSSVEMFLSSLRAGVFGELSKKGQDKVDGTHKSVVRLIGLVKELLYLDRLELEMRTEKFAENEILTCAIDTVRELAEKAKTQIEVRSCGARISGDRNRLVQVVVNLLSNAIKYSPEGSKVILETREGEDYFECRVIDAGCGIPEELRKQVFEPFKQIEADSGIKKGTGLGLTISQSIITQHGGTIGVDSAEGEGSIFWFKVPSVAVDSAADLKSKITLSRLPVLKPDRKNNRIRPGCFSVLQQGLIIIALPLIFQFAFASVIGCMLFQVAQQVHREEQSKEYLDTLNRMAEGFTMGSHFGMMYAFTHNPVHLSVWKNSKRSAEKLLKQLTKLSAGDPAKQEDIQIIAASMEKISTHLAQNVIPKKQNSLTTFADIRAGGIGAFLNIQNLIKDSGTISLIKPGVEGLKAQERLMTREREIGEKLSVQRVEMINNLQLALAAGYALNIVLSIYLAAYMMQNLSSRLQHVMKNTDRLVKRERLEPPLEGNDEIAFLDRTLYDTASRLVKLERFKRELIAIVSHELRTPLLSISAALDLFESGTLGNLSPKAKNRLRIAQEEASRLIRLINDLLDIEKMEAGKFVLNLNEVSVRDLVDASTAAVAQLAELKQIRLVQSVPDLIVKADRDRICQVLINLLSNAIKFSPSNAIVNVDVVTIDSNIEFRVTDHGRGIPAELTESIFDRFFQVEKTDSVERGGSGLGLAIARAIVEQHEGSIGVASRPGLGSSFWFRLPSEEILKVEPSINVVLVPINEALADSSKMPVLQLSKLGSSTSTFVL